ncbi:hypothetical protein J6590_014344 [Homalodisca vitripennis]|nr:hypothetical protein J6590_014344 [Homalodisca vitripennis]
MDVPSAKMSQTSGAVSVKAEIASVASNYAAPDIKLFMRYRLKSICCITLDLIVHQNNTTPVNFRQQMSQTSSAVSVKAEIVSVASNYAAPDIKLFMRYRLKSICCITLDLIVHQNNTTPVNFRQQMSQTSGAVSVKAEIVSVASNYAAPDIKLFMRYRLKSICCITLDLIVHQNNTTPVNFRQQMSQTSGAVSVKAEIVSVASSYAAPDMKLFVRYRLKSVFCIAIDLTISTRRYTSNVYTKLPV